MKNILYLLAMMLLCSIGSSSAQSSCASIIKNIGFEKKRGNIEYVTKLNATVVLFYAEDQYYGKELWKTDGTLQGTSLVKDIAPGTKSSRYGYEAITGNITVSDIAGDNKPVVLNGIMYFEANDGTHGYEIWRSDGTDKGTFMITEINEGAAYDREKQSFRSFFIYNNEVYFWDNSRIIFNSTPVVVWRLFKTKGSIESTTLVGEFQNFQSFKPKLFNYKGSLSFLLGPSSYETRIEESNRFYQMNTLGQISKIKLHVDGINNISAANGQLYFTNKKGLFKSDGTMASTILVRESGSVFSTNSINTDFWGDDRFVYFLHNSSLWRTDGTMTGTFSLQNNVRFSNTDLFSETRVFIYKNELYFIDYGTKNNLLKGVKVWKTNGTIEGTIPVVDVDPEGKGEAIIRLVTEIDGNLYFYGKVNGVSADANTKSGIWKTDGTQSGTKVLCPLGPDLECRMINPTFKDYGFLSIDKSLIFLGFPTSYANNNYDDTELYRTDLKNCPNISLVVTGSLVFCPNTTTTLSATATGGMTPYTYRWQQGTTAIGTGSASLTVNAAGAYTVIATDANGCSGSSPVTATQRTAPTVSLPAAVSFCAGQPITLTATAAGGTSPYTYAWKQGTAVIGTSAATLSVNAGGTYVVTVTDASGCASSSATATVTQRPSPTVTVTASAPGFTAGNSVTLTANTGTGLTYQWTRDGQPIAGATQATYVAQQPGDYGLTVSQDGCSATATATQISLITAIEEPQTGPDFTLTASPNPNPGAIQIRIVTQPGRTISVTLTLHDLTGRSLWQKQISVAGQHTEQLDLTPQPTAIYLLRATSNGQQGALRLLRQ
ncbi:T9SS type A sorting domain-containing protein [Fibrella aquatilis]|uniref:T9SS type A sorting domain-containing protein n=1 Tax=Fibrella aquatilis TaxID=2817059 RepID=A0A939JYF6_9BACT|nr:T9SS type A sorting domain-containing protein [Fibrella aquatilis]MBO0929816.1 T9SS type A sorting domain-containing protein [Fibrella aquatilis]